MEAEREKAKKITELYNKLKRKGDFKSNLAQRLGMSAKYITVYWFPNGEGVTNVYRELVIRELEDAIKLQ